jgi:hypothetical protein
LEERAQQAEAKESIQQHNSTMTRYRIPHTLSKTFYNPDDWRKPFHCEKCDSRFPSYKKLHDHKTKVHAY